MGRILVVDNYDSFTYNLSHMLEAITGGRVDVMRTDAIDPNGLRRYSHIVFSPGPGLPQESQGLMQLVSEALKLAVPSLGVCLGLQAMAVVTGGRLSNLKAPWHGVAHTIDRVDSSCPLLEHFTDSFEVGRYHSWIVDGALLPECWQVTCRDRFGEIMALSHRAGKAFGIQFHPESVLTPNGRLLLENFVKQ